ncbi:MAG TPA: AAA family ATPase, partial [Thermoleophilaceae bacterium]|nr:AAA family ATPase [Thermoleophilaceae bacterium]
GYALAVLRVHVLGDLALELDGEPLDPPAGRRARELLGWLALNPGTHARSELASRFWPDVLDSSARASLRTALHELRRDLGAAAGQLTATRERVGLEGELWVDALEFRALVQDDRLEEALALSRGEPMSGLDEDWVIAVREDHRHALAGVLERLAGAAESAGDPEAAVRFSRELTRLDPLSEEAARALMERLAAAGDRPAAVVAYERLRERLRRELSMAPSRATRELAETLREDAPAPPAAATPALPPPLRRRERSRLVGRVAELERARELVARSLEGDLRLTLISGEPGIGKSRLLGELCRAAHDGGTTVLFGRCYEEPLGPYQPFAEALSDYLQSAAVDASDLGAGAGELARLSPRLADRLGVSADPAGDATEGARFRLFEAVVSLLEHGARRGPVLVVLDDLHWADQATLLLLSHLVRSPLERVALAGAYRESELSRTQALAGALADLRRDRLVERIPLSGLDQAEVAGLVTTWVGPEAPPELSGAVHEETGGNPFFVEEVLRHLTESGAIRREGARWVTRGPVADLGIPEGVKEVIGRRLSRLSESTNRILAAAAVAGRSFSLPLLERVEPLAEDEVLESVEEATAAQLVREEPDRPGSYSFAHPLVHETLYDELSLARRVRLHGALADALDADDPDLLVRVARHRIEAASEGGRHRAAAAALAAARHDLGRLAYEEAADICERALEVADRREDRRELLLVRGDSLSRAGDLKSARACFREAAELARSGDGSAADRDALARAALGFSGLGVTILEADPEVVGLLREALTAVGRDEHARRAQLLSRLTIELYYGSTPEQRQELGRAAVEEAGAAGDEAALADALGALHVALWYPDGLDERLEVSAELVSVARRAGDREHELQGHNWCVLDLLEAGNLAGVDLERAEHERLAAELRLPGFQWWGHTWAAMRAMLDGRYPDAHEELERLRAIAERIGDPNAQLFHRLGLFHLEFEDQAISDEMLAFGLEQSESSPAGYAYRGALACVYAWRGERDEALRQLALLGEHDFAALRPDMNRLAATADLAVAAWHLDHAPTAAGIYETARRWSGRLALDGRAFYCYGSIDLFLGMLATVLERYEQADAHFRLALATNKRIRSAPWLAHTQARYGEMLLRRGRSEDRERGAELLHQGVAEAAALGLTRTASEFESRLSGHR